MTTTPTHNTEISDNYIWMYRQLPNMRKNGECTEEILDEMMDLEMEMDESTVQYIESVLGENCFC